jgi:hypothetical protein
MIHNQNHDQARSDRPHSLPVCFEFTDPDAGSVYIAGTFNNWQPDAKPMHPVGNNRWIRDTSCRSAPMNTAWSWMENFGPIRGQGKACRMRSAAGIRF